MKGQGQSALPGCQGYGEAIVLIRDDFQINLWPEGLAPLCTLLRTNKYSYKKLKYTLT